MIIERPPLLYRLFFPFATWRRKVKGQKTIYLTFDDGPIPEVTPWVLDLLDKYKVKATFFCVGENAKRNSEIYRDILYRGHSVGNHTYNHLKGIKTSSSKYMSNVRKCNFFVNSKLFRAPYGNISIFKQLLLQKSRYKLIMWDVVTRDYSRYMTPEKVLKNVKKYTRDGSIIVFHDSKRAEKNLKGSLPQAIEWLIKEGYKFERL